MLHAFKSMKAELNPQYADVQKNIFGALISQTACIANPRLLQHNSISNRFPFCCS